MLTSQRKDQKLATRRDLLLAGRRLLSDEGLYESRIEDITKRAGIAKGTLYTHFRSKEELVLAVVSDGFEELRQYVSKRLENRRGPEEIAAEIFAAHVLFFSEHPDLLRIFHQVRGVLKFNQPRWRPLRGCLRAHLKFLSRHLAGRESKSAPARRLQDLAIFLFGCASGTCSVFISAYPRARLQQWGISWSELMGSAANARRSQR